MRVFENIRKKVKFYIAGVMRRLRFNGKSCKNCFNDHPIGLPINCGYKDALLLGHKPENQIFCAYWRRK